MWRRLLENTWIVLETTCLINQVVITPQLLSNTRGHMLRLTLYKPVTIEHIFICTRTKFVDWVRRVTMGYFYFFATFFTWCLQSQNVLQVPGDYVFSNKVTHDSFWQVCFKITHNIQFFLGKYGAGKQAHFESLLLSSWELSSWFPSLLLTTAWRIESEWVRGKKCIASSYITLFIFIPTYFYLWLLRFFPSRSKSNQRRKKTVSSFKYFHSSSIISKITAYQHDHRTWKKLNYMAPPTKNIAFFCNLTNTVRVEVGISFL